MLKNTLTGLDKKKLRRWILLFFFALAIPTVILIQQSYSRLKWETVHQHQLMADELATRIDNQFIRLINKEEERAFTDYSFLNIAGDPKANLLQRSPLSKFPIESEIDGIIGFFQVNNKGELMTPLVPEAIKSGKSAKTFGITKDELDSRLALQDEIQSILSQNSLVKDTVLSNKKVLSQVIKGRRKNEKTSKRKDQNRDQNRDQSKDGLTSVFSSASSSKQDKSQVAFDRLKRRPSKKAAETKLGRLEDLKISKRYEEKTSKEVAQVTQRKAKSTYSKAPSKGLSKQVRTEQNVLPESELAEIISQVEESRQSRSSDYVGSYTSVYSDSDGDVSNDSIISKNISSDSSVTALGKDDVVEAQSTVSSKRSLKILTFESTIDPFEFSQLDSGHFVLYRNVWLNDQRYIQGLLIEQQTFLESIINTAFRNTSLAEMSDVLVIHQGNVLTAFSGQNTGYLTSKLERRGELGGELLYQARLSAPLSDLQLLFNITQLPIGAGGKVILWLSFILASILCVGFYLMYRLGLGQINLARQQQDFVSAVSHELKTPLTSIRMYGEILREGWANEEKKKSYYDFIYHESERLSRLINNVLHLARMTRNEQSAVIKKTKVAKLMDEVNSKVSTQIMQAGYELVIACGDKNDDKSDDESTIEVDEDWFIQVMINLVDNAIKFSSNSEVKQVDITCMRKNNNKAREARIDFLVRDYGPGIDKQQMRKVFKLFYRSESELTRETVGTGIGLALVHQMTAAMGGEIDVVNRSPGAEFRVSFPVSD